MDSRDCGKKRVSRNCETSGSFSQRWYSSVTSDSVTPRRMPPSPSRKGWCSGADPSGESGEDFEIIRPQPPVVLVARIPEAVGQILSVGVGPRRSIPEGVLGRDHEEVVEALGEI